MLKKRLVAAILAATLLVLGPTGALATQKQQNREQSEQRDGHSRHEGKSLTYVPLVFDQRETMRVVSVVMVAQYLTYLSLMNWGVDVTSQDRVGLGGVPLLGGIFADVYDSDDFTEANDVGTVFHAGDDQLVVALKDNLKLEDYQVIIFNASNQYTVGRSPRIEQVPPEKLAALGVVPIMSQVLLHSAVPEALDLLGNLSADQEPDPALAQNLGVDMLTHMPVLQRHVVGRAYRGPGNTLFLVVRPAIVMGDRVK